MTEDDIRIGTIVAKDPVHQHEGKWWFWDETWADRHGPYDSAKEASDALDVYCREVLGQP